MLPDISPDLVAEAAVQVNGGYDGRFGVSIKSTIIICLKTYTLFDNK